MKKKWRCFRHLNAFILKTGSADFSWNFSPLRKAINSWISSFRTHTHRERRDPFVYTPNELMNKNHFEKQRFLLPSNPTSSDNVPFCFVPAHSPFDSASSFLIDCLNDVTLFCLLFCFVKIVLKMLFLGSHLNMATI